MDRAAGESGTASLRGGPGAGECNRVADLDGGVGPEEAGRARPRAVGPPGGTSPGTRATPRSSLQERRAAHEPDRCRAPTTVVGAVAALHVVAGAAEAPGHRDVVQDREVVTRVGP